MSYIHKFDIHVADYPFHEKLKDGILPILENYPDIQKRSTNVKASHTEWNWQPQNIQIIKLKKYLLSELQKWKPHRMVDNTYPEFWFPNFWVNTYSKGDYAKNHSHYPFVYSIVYFLQSKWYYSPLIFTDSGKRVMPKEGRYVIFPAYVKHKVPKFRFNGKRITIAGNISELYFSNPDRKK